MRIIAINVGAAAPLFIPASGAAGAREQVMSGIRKSAVSTLATPDAIALRPLGLEGDEQADLTVHGGRDKALYAYPLEHYATWQTMRMQATHIDEPLPLGFFGENLTVEGLFENRVWIGDVLEIRESNQSGSVRLRVTAPRHPCFKFNARMGFKHASRMMVQSGYTGFYLEVLQTGRLRAGDAIRLIAGAREVTVEDMHRLNTRGKQRSLL